MRYYLETSAIRKLSPKLSTFASNSNVFTSSLVLFELISGMTERDYALRKMTIKRTLESGINIDFDSFDIKKYKCVGIEEDDIDGKLAKEMANIIINSTSFSELENERIFINNDIFSLADFTLFDKNLSETIVNLTNQAAEIFSVRTKEEKKHDRNILLNEGMLFSYSRILSEILVSTTVENATQTYRPSEEYFSVIEKYDGSLDLFCYCIVCKSVLAQIQGNTFGKNDGFDILHTCFMSHDDVIVSDDQIFKVIEKDCSGPKCYTSEEFENEFVRMHHSSE